MQVQIQNAYKDRAIVPETRGWGCNDPARNMTTETKACIMSKRGVVLLFFGAPSPTWGRVIKKRRNAAKAKQHKTKEAQIVGNP